MVCGSMTFSKEMKEIEKKLKELGHRVLLPWDIEYHLKNPELIDDLDSDLKHLKEKDVLRKCFNLIEKSDAILVLNPTKNNIEGYVGTSTLMETAIAFYLNKKIFILNKIPDSKKRRWAHEINYMQPTILNGDLSKIQ